MDLAPDEKARKSYRPLPDYDALIGRWVVGYDESSQDKGLAATVLRKTHALIERPFGPDRHFPLVLEIGAGTLAHLPFVRHGYDRYVASDADETVLEQARKRDLPPRVEMMKIDGATLPFEDDSVDRVIATHVLEHIPAPHLALEEWVRVLKPGGVLSLILPCDPGWAWRLGRHLGPRREAEKSGLPYDYFMARQHVNSIFGLREILKYHFPRREEQWWPTRIPLPDLNIIYAGNFYV